MRGVAGRRARCAGAAAPGPSDDGHVLLGGVGTALPIVPTSKYRVRDGRLLLDGRRPRAWTSSRSQRPAFYDLTTADGMPYEKIARLHGSDVLATTVVQTCIRYDEAERCRFCAIEESLASGRDDRGQDARRSWPRSPRRRCGWTASRRW